MSFPEWFNADGYNAFNTAMAASANKPMRPSPIVFDENDEYVAGEREGVYLLIDRADDGQCGWYRREGAGPGDHVHLTSDEAAGFIGQEFVRSTEDAVCMDLFREIHRLLPEAFPANSDTVAWPGAAWAIRELAGCLAEIGSPT